MENQTRESKFELSVLGAVWTVVFYSIIVGVIMIVLWTPFSLIIDSIYSTYSFENIENVKAVMNLVGNTILKIIIIVLAVKKAKRMSDNNFRIKYMGKLNCKLLISVIFLIIGYYFFYQSSIGIITDKIPLPEWLKEIEREMELHPYITFVSMAIVAPIFEEFFMRGVILTGLLNRYNPKKAIIVSALIFGIWHFNIVQSVNTTLIGLVLGIIYYKTNSLILCITLHMTNNIFAGIMGEAKEYMGYSPTIISFLIGMMIFIGSGVLFFRYLRESDENLKINKLSKKGEV
ncbi:CPBP family intramembrane glutamic endopeptidase [Psychrilyobacter atlanticus]|uniref:CPBP family intramembrane glutamic endopeptidase n=1 Tax=Psychrilyobacter atlanticus TaxID=271091 RepID=UPI00041B1646|nr:type II CAAX endopeptidase family protein [Psychrilyobacter atlanticus]